MAAAAGLIPGKVEKVQSFLREAAVGDASHDFSDSRAGGNLFNSIFKTYKDIGAPTFPSHSEDEETMSEFEILNSIFQFAPTGTKDSDLIGKFRENILVDNKEQTFKRWDEDPILYKMTTKRVAIRPKGGEYQWTLSSKEMFEFMKGSKSDMVFAVDAANVPFYDRMLEEKGTQTKTGTYVYMRESVNDAAQKVVIPKTMDTVIGIETIEDTASFNVMYPAVRSTSNEEISKLSEQELFYSNYSLALASDPKNPSPSVTLSFYDKQMIRQIQIMKGRKEDAHPNSVPTLSNKIRELLQYLTPKGNLNKKMEYFTALQQKRSGDWLQVLGCLQPERFGLPASTRITMVTLDKICVAYAIFSGVDVMMTYFYLDPDPAKPNEYWMIRIYKDYQAVPETKEQQLSKIIQFYPRPESINIFISQGEQKSFTEYKQFYKTVWKSIDDTLKREVNKSIQKINEIVYIPRFDPKKFIKQYITKVLDDVTTLAVFRSLAPEIDATYANEEVQLYTQAVTTASYNRVLSMFERYKKNYAILKNAILSKKTNALSTEHAIQSYFTAIYNKNKLNTKTHKERFELIEELQIFGKLFSSRNGGRNGVGIFTFLSIHLLPQEAKELREAINTSAIHVPEDVKSQYMEFVSTANLLLGEREDVSIQQITVENKDILESVNSQFPNPPISIVSESVIQAQIPEQTAPIVLVPVQNASSTRKVGKKSTRGQRSPQPSQVNGQPVAKQHKIAEATTVAVAAAATLASPEEKAEKAFSEATTVAAVGPAIEISDNAKKVNIETSSNTLDPDNSFQITDYTAALTLLTLRFNYIQTPQGQHELEEFIQKNKVTNIAHVGGSKKSKQFSRKSVQSRSLILHNPYTTFYFLLRELSYRLSKPLEIEEQKYNMLVTNMILKLIKQKDTLVKQYSNKFLFKGKQYTSNPVVLEYMLFTTLEHYILGRSNTVKLLSISSYYWNDIIQSYLQGHMNAKELHYIKDKLFLSEEDILNIFAESSTFTSKKDLVQASLAMMNELIKYVGNLDMRLKFLKVVKSARKTLKRSARFSSRVRSSLKSKSIKSARASQRQPSRRSVKSSQRQPSRRFVKNIIKKPKFNIQIVQNMDPIQKQITPQNKLSQKLQPINSENPIEFVNY